MRLRFLLALAAVAIGIVAAPLAATPPPVAHTADWAVTDNLRAIGFSPRQVVFPGPAAGRINSDLAFWGKADRLHPLIPRESKRWRDLYRGRAFVEREFGRLKHQYGLAPLRVRGLESVQLHADLCILARLAVALARARAVPLAA